MDLPARCWCHRQFLVSFFSLPFVLCVVTDDHNPSLRPDECKRVQRSADRRYGSGLSCCRLFREGGRLLHTGEPKLCCLDKQTVDDAVQLARSALFPVI